jgi:hypothetical protein
LIVGSSHQFFHTHNKIYDGHQLNNFLKSLGDVLELKLKIYLVAVDVHVFDHFEPLIRQLYLREHQYVYQG